MKKRKPFSEIMDLKLELKEYRRLCKQKSKKYKYYSEWQNHITERLQVLDSNKKLDDYKHYCIHVGRAENWYKVAISEIAASIASVMFVMQFPDQQLIITMIAFFVVYFIFLGFNAEKARDNYFYSDIVQIIEERQKSLSESS